MSKQGWIYSEKMVQKARTRFRVSGKANIIFPYRAKRTGREKEDFGKFGSCSVFEKRKEQLWQ